MRPAFLSTAISSDKQGVTGAGISMMAEEGVVSTSALRRRIDAASRRLSEMKHVIDLDQLRSQMAALEHEAASQGVWDVPHSAQKLLSQLERVRGEVAQVEGYDKDLDEASFALELIECEQDPGPTGSSRRGGSPSEDLSIMNEALKALGSLESSLERWEMTRLLNGPYDHLSARVSLNAGAGGLDAMDWTEMVERMYLRWGQRRGFVVEVVERQEGEEAGIKGCEMEVRGRMAYGWLRGEKGAHRLVRSSPFNSKGLRQTSFCGVEVMPILSLDDESISGSNSNSNSRRTLEIDEKDLEVTFQRSGGAGGESP